MGPLAGVRVVEIASLGPGPFAAMMLADMGAEVIRIDRKGAPAGSRFEVMNRGRRSLALDLKRPEAVAALLRMLGRVDALQEGFRPGVMERLDLGPEACFEANPRLVYGRMTGWGQDGPLAQAAGHDLNYIALSGALHAIGPAGGGPVPPLNLVGDFGGGAMYLAFGMVCALLEAQRSGQGQVVDAAMVDGASSLMALFHGLRAAGLWKPERGTNLLDGGAPFYGAYACADGEYITLGAYEPQFYALLRDKLGLDDPQFDSQMDQAAWPELKEKVAAIVAGKTRAEWTALLEGGDVCFAPVLSMAEVAGHPHNAARGTIIEVAGVAQPAPAPRFSRTRPDLPTPPAKSGADTRAILDEFGFSSGEIGALEAAGAI